eukprot:scaffold20981_cov122-Isochrysis_galbana.AAC.2
MSRGATCRKHVPCFGHSRRQGIRNFFEAPQWSICQNWPVGNPTWPHIGCSRLRARVATNATIVGAASITILVIAAIHLAGAAHFTGGVAAPGAFVMADLAVAAVTAAAARSPLIISNLTVGIAASIRHVARNAAGIAAPQALLPRPSSQTSGWPTARRTPPAGLKHFSLLRDSSSLVGMSRRGSRAGDTGSSSWLHRACRAKSPSQAPAWQRAARGVCRPWRGFCIVETLVFCF